LSVFKDLNINYISGKVGKFCNYFNRVQNREQIKNIKNY